MVERVDAVLSHPERVAIARLQALLELLPTALDKELAASGLTAFEFTLLEALADAENERMRMSALAARTNATLPRLSRVVNALERKGLVERAHCSEDGRAINAQLTAAGRAAFAAAKPRYDSAVKRLVLDGLDDTGVTQLAELSLNVLAHLDPNRRLAVTAEGAPVCAADPAPASCPADPALPAH